MKSDVAHVIILLNCSWPVCAFPEAQRAAIQDLNGYECLEVCVEVIDGSQVREANIHDPD